MSFAEKIMISAGLFSAIGVMTNSIVDIADLLISRKNEPKNTKKDKVNARPVDIPNHLQKTNTCRICNQEGKTEWHHIISRGWSKRNDRKDLIENPGNQVELCRPCHDKTTASLVRKHLEKRGR